MEYTENIHEKTPGLSKNTGDNFGITGANDGSPTELGGSAYHEDNGIEWTSHRGKTGVRVLARETELSKPDTAVPLDIARTAIKELKENNLSGANHG